LVSSEGNRIKIELYQDIQDRWLTTVSPELLNTYEQRQP
jgi:hypothetical protein